MEDEEKIIEKVIDLIEYKKIKQLREFLDNINEADFPMIFRIRFRWWRKVN